MGLNLFQRKSEFASGNRMREKTQDHDDGGGISDGDGGITGMVVVVMVMIATMYWDVWVWVHKAQPLQVCPWEHSFTFHNSPWE